VLPAPFRSGDGDALERTPGVNREPLAAATWWCCALTAVGAIVSLGCGGQRTTASMTIQIKGSDTVVNVAQAWAEEYRRVRPDVNVEVSGGGSGVGIAALSRGTINIATASREIKRSEAEKTRAATGREPFDIILGHDALAVFVNRSNPMDSISLAELKEIFVEHGTTTHWSQLGVTIPGVKDDEIVRISRQSSSGTYEFFRERVLDEDDFKLGSRDMNGSKEVVELVGAARTAIGYSGMGYASEVVKMLAIVTAAGDEPVAPSVPATLDGSYPLARSLHLYTLGEPEGEVRRFVEWVLSPAGQAIVEESGFVPFYSAHKER
jgi:phosphate transport system substrate-binding protein